MIVSCCSAKCSSPLEANVMLIISGGVTDSCTYIYCMMADTGHAVPKAKWNHWYELSGGRPELNLDHQYSQINSVGGKMRLNRSSLDLTRPLAPFILRMLTVSAMPLMQPMLHLWAGRLVMETLRPESTNLKCADRKWSISVTWGCRRVAWHQCLTNVKAFKSVDLKWCLNVFIILGIAHSTYFLTLWRQNILLNNRRTKGLLCKSA